MRNSIITIVAILCITGSAESQQIYNLFKTSRDSVYRTRANATTYSANDIIRDSTRLFIPITVCGKNFQGWQKITAAMLSTDTSLTTNANFKLVLYKDTTGMGASLPLDNAQYMMKNTFDSLYIGEIPFVQSTFGTGSTGTRSLTTFLDIPFVVKNSGTKIYAVLLADGAYAPLAGQKYFFNLWVLQCKNQ